ncbi:glycosyltransferase [Glutamicibacter arilaitensis]|uniref:glycosyltransferase n=1 Tax=Glutamicibacter arilaitensis TaxID=256701 RepID=UPI003FD0CB14
MATGKSLFSRFRPQAKDTANSGATSVTNSSNIVSLPADATKVTLSTTPRCYRMMLMGAFAAHPGNGLVISVLRRAQVLRDRGNQVEIVAFPFDARYRHSAQTVAKKWKFGETIRLRNPFAELAGDEYNAKAPSVDPLPAGAGWEIVADPADAKNRRAYENGVYRQFIYSDAKTRVVFIDYLDEKSARFKRSWHDNSGRIIKFEYFNAQNKPVNVEYVHNDGSVHLTAKVNEQGKEHHFELSLPDGRTGFFNTLGSLETWWLINFVFGADIWNPVISEYGFRAAVFEEVAKQRKISVAYALHNLHLTAPYSYGSAIKPELVPFFNDIKKYDAVVALTDEQRLDLVRSLDCSDNVFVIPHHFEPQRYASEKAPHSVVMSSRVVRYKGHFDAVSVWPRIVKEFPDAVLHIYGTGPDLEALRKEVNTAGLESSVLLHGFERDIVRKVSEVEIAIFPSQFEGFALSLIESMAAGTVPVAYDFKYGAQAMIEHGVNGFITERSNAVELADSVIYLMKNPKILKSMSDSSKKIVEKYNARRLGDDWIGLFDELECRFESKTNA